LWNTKLEVIRFWKTFAASSGNVSDEVIAQYIHNQDIEENMKGDNFEIRKL